MSDHVKEIQGLLAQFQREEPHNPGVQIMVEKVTAAAEALTKENEWLRQQLRAGDEMLAGAEQVFAGLMLAIQKNAPDAEHVHEIARHLGRHLGALVKIRSATKP